MFIEEVFAPLLEGFDRGSFFENLNKLKLLLHILEKSYVKENPQLNDDDQIEPKEKVAKNCNASDSLYAPFANTVLQKIRSKLSKLFGETQIYRY